MFKNITRTVWIISLVSLLNDFSSEMLYPVIPLYLKQIGYGTLLIGILEGVAECIAGLSKIYFGSLSDSFERRTPFVNIGYFLSVISRPLIGISSFVPLIFTGRSLDKIGKGIRTGSRDAILADECNEKNSAEIFGFHRSMDTTGAILGPLLAIIYLFFHHEDFKSLFFIAVIPGLLAVSLTFFIKEKKRTEVKKKTYSLKTHFSFYKEAPKPYLNFLILMILFSLANSSDMFLLLKAREAGMSENKVLIMYILFNLVFALFAFPIGKLADKFGKTRMLVIGLFIYVLTYLGFAYTNNIFFIAVSFIGYGLYYAFSQSTMKALLIQKVEANQKAGAIGFYEGLNSFALLIANGVAGLIWYQFGAVYMFAYTAIIVLVVIALIIKMQGSLNLKKTTIN